MSTFNYMEINLLLDEFHKSGMVNEAQKGRELIEKIIKDACVSAVNFSFNMEPLIIPFDVNEFHRSSNNESQYPDPA